MTPTYIEVVLKPKQFLKSLPSGKVTFVSLAIILILWANSILQGLVILKEYAFDITLIFQELTILIFGIIFFASLIFAVCKLIKRKITFYQIINIISFSQIPRLYFVTMFTIVYLMFPEILSIKFFNKVINFIILALTIYSVILTLYGVAINTNQNKKLI